MCFKVVLAYEIIMLCKCSAKYIDIYFKLKITFFLYHIERTVMIFFVFLDYFQIGLGDM